MKKYFFIFGLQMIIFSQSCNAIDTVSFVSLEAKSSTDGGSSVVQSNITIDKNEGIIYFDDVGFNYNVCTDPNWFCIFGKRLNFSISKSWSPVRTKVWSKYSYKFRYVGDIRNSEREVIHIIEVEGPVDKNEDPSFVYYSKARGVVGFSFLYGSLGYSETFWLVGSQGLN